MDRVIESYKYIGEMPLYNNSDQKTKCPHDRLTFVIDTSGSTNDTGNGLRSHHRGLIDATTTSTTPCIIIAEMNGLVKTMQEYANKFEIKDVELVFICFSDNILCKSIILNNSEDLYKFACDIKLHVIPEFGGTNTLEAVKRAFDDRTIVNTLFVIATDGKPTSSDTKNIIDYMKETYDKYNRNECILDVLVIGAGSIMQSTGLTRSISRHSYNGGGQCNIGFLNELKQHATIGVYLPACTDFHELHEALRDYFREIENGIKNLTWKVRLDTSVINLPQHINNKLVKVRSAGHILVDKTSFGTYLYNILDTLSAHQIRLEYISESTVTSDRNFTGFEDCEIVSEIHHMYNYINKEELFSIVDHDLMTHQIKTLKKIDDDYIETIYCFDLTLNGQFKIRKLLCY